MQYSLTGKIYRWPSFNQTERKAWKDVTPGFPEGRSWLMFLKIPSLRVLVAMVWKGDFKWSDKDRTGLSMLMDILEIKCRESMREDQGGVYGVSIEGSIDKYTKDQIYNNQSTWGCSPENIQKLTATLLDEMKKDKRTDPCS